MMNRFIGAAAVAVAVSGCASNPGSVPQSSIPAPTASALNSAPNGLPERVATAPTEVRVSTVPVQSLDVQPQSINLGAYDRPSTPVQSVDIGAYYASPQQIAYAAEPAPAYVQVSGQPRRLGSMAPVRDDPLTSSPVETRASTYNVAALKAAYQPSEALRVSAPPPRVRNMPSASFGRQLSDAAIARLNPSIRYVAAYKKIGYPWGDVSQDTGVCTDVVIRSYRGLGIDLQSMVHQDMRQAFSAYPSQKIYGLRKADPNIDHRRVVNLEAFFERVGASIPVGSTPMPGDVITWRLSGGEPHVGVVVNRVDPKSGNPLIVHNLGAGVRAEDLLDYAPPHGHYRFAPDEQSRMASLALKRG